MFKSHFKQAALAAIGGPLGLFYVSIKAGAAFTLATLVSIILFENHLLYLLLASIPVSILSGVALVHLYNSKAKIREFNLSGYSGDVSYQVVSNDGPVREYHKSLNKTRLKKKLNTFAYCALALLCFAVIGLIAAPDMARDLKEYSLAKLSNPAVESKPVESADSGDEIALPTAGDWIQEKNEGNNFSAMLLANDYLDIDEIPYRPKIQISCVENRTIVEFVAGKILAPEDIEISLSFADKNQISNSWKTTADYQSAIAPDPIQIAKQINKNSHVDVEFLPFGATNKETASFNLTNSSDTVNTIRRNCSW